MPEKQDQTRTSRDWIITTDFKKVAGLFDSLRASVIVFVVGRIDELA